LRQFTSLILRDLSYNAITSISDPQYFSKTIDPAAHAAVVQGACTPTTSAVNCPASLSQLVL
jgi:hypothetical protein